MNRYVCRRPDRLSAWCHALHSDTYQRTTSYLIERIGDGVARCAVGVACDLATADHVIALVAHPVTGDPAYLPREGASFPLPALTAWLGIDNISSPLDLSRCPNRLRQRITDVMTVGGHDWSETSGTEPWRLNDRGVPWPDIADALRCHYSVERHRVPGTDEHAAAVAVEAAYVPRPRDAGPDSCLRVPSQSDEHPHPGVTGPGTTGRPVLVSVQ